MAAQPNPDDFLADQRTKLALLARIEMPQRLRSKLDSSDIVHQTLLDVLPDRGRLEAMPEPERAAFLRRCLKNNVIDAVRKFQPDHPLGDVEHSSARIESWLAAKDSSPSDRAEREERLKILADALTALPTDQRIAVEFKHLDGMSVREIAEQMGRSVTAVGGLLRRGVRELRERLGAGDAG